MLTEKDLIESGYKRFNQASETIRGASYGLQRKIQDDLGIRYYITVYVYDWRPYKMEGRVFPNDFSFMPDVQFLEDGVCPTVDMTYHDDDGTTVQSMEAFFDRAWQFMGMPYNDRKTQLTPTP